MRRLAALSHRARSVFVTNLSVHGHRPSIPQSPQYVLNLWDMGSSEQYLSVRETARRLGVHENTVRNWVTQGILRSARVPGARFHRFDTEDVERLSSARGLAVAPANESRRLISPGLVSATDLAAWADREQAKYLFPRLVRRLLAASPEVSRLLVRAHEGVALEGWDGEVTASSASHWVPAGVSGWEFSTKASSRAKAQEEYDKRIRNPLGLNPSTTTFVFATPRRWARGSLWEKERRADKVWRDVRVLDADAIEAWLESTPAVHYWISEELGLRPRDAVTLGRWWQEFTGRTKPPIPAALLLAGREEQQQELRRFLEGERGAIGLQGRSRDEGVAFVAAALGADERDLDAGSAVVVSARSTWDRLVSSSSRPMVLIPTFDDAPTGTAVAAGHRVVMPVGWQDLPRTSIILLPRPDRLGAQEAFQAAGVSLERASHLAALARRSLPALMRRLAADPRVARPPWATGEEVDLLAPLMLVGAWSASEADRSVVANLVGASWADIERHLRRWSQTDDPPFTPFTSFTEGWHLTSPEEAFEVFRAALSASAIERWRETVEQVLGEADPRIDLSGEERLTASFNGPRLTYSEMLRNGLARSVALLGAFGEEDYAGPAALAEYVRQIVRSLLATANADDSGSLWRSLAAELPLLAEGAPEEFLEAVDIGLSGPEPLLMTMFRDHHDRSFLATSSPHTNLLWSLETLCWSPEWLGQALLALARLAEIDPQGKLANRPAASLRAVLLPWVPYTSATVAQRLLALQQIRRRHPKVGWQLLLDLLPKHQDVSSPTSAPRFRDWKPDRVGTTITDWLASITGLIDQALDDVARDSDKWMSLLERISALPPDQLGRVLGALETVIAVDGLTSEQRLALWQVITKESAHHREFPDAEWSMDKQSLSRLEAVGATLKPEDPVALTTELFDWRPVLPGVDRFDHPSYEDALAKARQEAVRQVLDTSGLDGLARLATEAPQPHLVGHAVAQAVGGQVAGPLLDWLGRPDAEGQMASGWAVEMANVGGAEWTATTGSRLNQLSIEGQTVLLQALRPGTELKQLLEAAPEAVRAAYWKSVNPLVYVDEAHVAGGVQQLMHHGRGIAAVDLLATRLHDGKSLPPGIDAELIIEALQSALSADPSDTTRPVALDYEVGVLLDRLERLDVDEERLAGLEWAYFRLLEHSDRSAPALYRALGKDPTSFVDLVSHVYRGKNERRRQLDESEAALARNAWSVLHSWRSQIPGGRDDGTVDGEYLHRWVREARLLLAERDREDIGDQQIGQVLSASPVGSDGAWPAEPVRELIEAIGSSELETGIHIGKRNSRGVTVRAAYAGGKQEREFAGRFREWAAATTGWPRTSRLLRRLAESYEHEARRIDAEAEARADRD
jgi:excisionase family DNA binding protein